MKNNISNFIEKKMQKQSLWSYADLACQYLKNKSQLVERSAEKRVQKNPLKSIGFAMLGGLILAKVLL